MKSLTRIHLRTCSAFAIFLYFAISAPNNVESQQQPDTAVHAPSSVPLKFDIPAQPLGSALIAFGQQSGLQVTFQPELVQDKSSPGTFGTLTATEALKSLLANTGLTYHFIANNTVTLESAPSTKKAGEQPKSTAAQEPKQDQVIPLPQVTVQDSREKGWVVTESSVGTKTDTPLIEVPQSISEVTRDQMDAQGAQTIIESALRYTSGVYLFERNDNARETLASRGFFLNGYLDGMKLASGISTTPRLDPYALERIEVFKGPTSVLYGQASPGGLYNLVSKRPTTQLLREVEITGGSFDRIQGSFDFGGPIDREGKLLYRFTGIGRDADTQVKHTKDQRIAIMPALTWRPWSNTNLTLLSSYQYDPAAGFVNQLPAEGTVLSNPNGKFSTSFYAGAPNFDEHQKRQGYAGYLFEHKFNDVWTARQNFRYLHVENDDAQVFSLGFEDDELRLLRRFVSRVRESVNGITLDNQGQAKVATGPLQHTFLFGLDYQWTSLLQRSGSGDAPPLDFLNPNYNQLIVSPELSARDQTAIQVGLYVQDQIKVGQWFFLFSGRQDWFDSNTRERSDGTRTKQSDNAFTWRAGLVYLFDIGLAPYFSYSESFEPETGTDFSGKPFKPTTGQQYEIGIKYQPKNVNAFLTFSAFQLTQQNILTSDPENPFNTIQTGEIRSRGIELEGKASLTEGLDMTAAYAYLDNRITKDNDGFEGKKPFGIPAHLASVWGNYTFRDGPLGGFSFGAGVRYVGSTWADFDNTYRVPAYTLADSAIRYDLTKLGSDILNGWRVALNVSNMFDKKYVARGCGTTFSCWYGLRRNIIPTLSYRW